ncbi:MAG TPA: ACT domain-containing protein [Kofleriaceae bacterium]|jgi:glycine cleavage system regulatory protein|nr:ACT domain-containing protein [Kofleriaceae bacterium]
MRNTLVLTVLAPDRTGLVELLAQRIAAAGGNWEESRMARLAGQFAGILLVTCDASRSDELVAAVRALESAGLQVTARAAQADAPAAPAPRVQLALTGGDRAGIVRDVSRVLAERGVNVEALESEVSSAPMSGERLFTARAQLRVPPGLALADLRASLEKLASELMVDLSVE